MIGQTISHYKILEKLGEGGMGVVYKAQDTKLNRPVALKFLPAHLSASEQDKARFLQEAQAAASLNHPNICTIYGIDEHEGQIFIAMELVEGETLREKKQSFSVKQTVDIGVQIAEGLSAAHEKGIVHRDIKPENIMIRKDGIVQIMDFGLAKLRGASRLTKEGTMVGTVGYMSPEQVQGHDTDHRTDIFSLGVILYELLSGQSPFKGVHETAIIYEIVNVDAAPISSLKPEVGPDLDAIVLECLAKEPDERYQSAKEVAKELRRFKRESSRVKMSRITAAQPVPAHVAAQMQDISTRGSRKRFVWPSLAGALGLTLLVFIWILMRSGNTQNIVARLAVTLPREELLNISVYTAVAISPDGTRLVYRSNDQLRLRNINSYLSTPIAGTEYASSPFFSPDNRWIGFFAGGKLKKVLVSGGAPIILADAPDNRGGSWGKDGTIVFSSATNVGISRVSDAGGAVETLTVPDSTKKERTHRWPQVLPDGKTVLFTVGSLENPDYYDDATIQAVNMESRKRSVILDGASLARYLPTGFLVYARAGVLLAVPFDANRLEIKGTAFPAIENVSGDASTAASNFAYADNGTLAYIPGETSRTNLTLALIDHNGVAAQLTAPPQAYIEPRMSPDGHRVAVVVNAERGFDLWVHDITRNTLSRLTFNGTNRTPAWSPDGKRIAYFSIVEGKASVMIKQADGTGNAEEVSSGLGRTYVDSWSRDGSYLFLDRTTNAGQSDIYVVPLKGDKKPWPLLATKFDEYQATLSPNGKWLAYISNESGTYQVYVLPFPKGEGKWQVSTEEGYEPHWSRDGKNLFYAAPSKQTIMAASIEGSTSIVIGKPRVAFTGYHALNSDSGISYDIAPDEQHFLTPRGKEGDDSFTRIHVVLNWFDDLQRLMTSSK